MTVVGVVAWSLMHPMQAHQDRRLAGALAELVAARLENQALRAQMYALRDELVLISAAREQAWRAGRRDALREIGQLYRRTQEVPRVPLSQVPEPWASWLVNPGYRPRAVGGAAGPDPGGLR